jgi:hypothetical protein
MERDRHLQFYALFMIHFGYSHQRRVEAAYMIQTIHLMKLLDHLLDENIF